MMVQNETETECQTYGPKLLELLKREKPKNEDFALFLSEIELLLKDHPAAILYRDPETQKSPLHIACEEQVESSILQALILAGNPWNAVDSNGKSAGEILRDLGKKEMYEYMVNEGVRTEFLFNILQKTGKSVNDDDVDVEEEEEASTSKEDLPKPNDEEEELPYLEQHLEYMDGKLVDAEKNGVMMGWEAPLMKMHADRLCPREGLNVLNVGFGLGIIDTFLQEKNPKHHVIIEAHPDVYKHMQETGWTEKSNVTVFFGKWQDVLGPEGAMWSHPQAMEFLPFDAIYFDTFGEFYADLKEFHDILPNILNEEDGIYSFFNGLGGTNPFFHDVYCRIAELDLNDIGLSLEWEEIDMEPLGDDVWNGLKREYWNLSKYRLPTCKLKPVM